VTSISRKERMKKRSKEQEIENFLSLDLIIHIVKPHDAIVWPCQRNLRKRKGVI
jgi:hypothetical protein